TVARLDMRRAIAPKQARRPAELAPIVKWAGGKTKLLEELVAHAPGTYRRYFEPFVGGGALFFRLVPDDAVLCDRNVDLINTYRCIAWNVEAVIKRLAAHKAKHGEAHYYQVRERFNQREGKQSDVERAAACIYLNKTCYNGLWRVNASGEFNVPIGRYTDPPICDAERLRAAAPVLQRADLRAGHYADAVDGARSRDLVYFDPPYHPVSDTANFTSYTADCFGEDDQRALAEVTRLLDARGCAVMVSNSDTPFIRALYRDYRITRVSCARAINTNAASRGAVHEVIVSNR
ncbi:MAG TPA: DNA adenine methylase, partial [Kofleriaceae bacterium]|nr:DNA adenine methylase [Kofleriaceae bacterium]